MSFNAFELVPVIDRVQLMGDKPKTTVRLISRKLYKYNKKYS